MTVALQVHKRLTPAEGSFGHQARRGKALRNAAYILPISGSASVILAGVQVACLCVVRLW